MLSFFHALRLLPVFLLTCTFNLCAQDMPVRVEAIRLLERANAVSRPNHLMPNHRLDVTFRAYGLDGTVQDGTANTIISGDIERYEWLFGSYHAISIHFPNKIVQDEYQPPPPETLELDALTPLLIGRFDKSDTIHSVTPPPLFARPPRCIRPATVTAPPRPPTTISSHPARANLLPPNVS